MDSTQMFIVAALIILAVGVVLIWLGQKAQRENLIYLNTYEHQDYYKNNPWINPLTFSYDTALFDLKRKYGNYPLDI
jgi:hypothetical protein